jgi:hypothetical protein
VSDFARLENSIIDQTAADMLPARERLHVSDDYPRYVASSGTVGKVLFESGVFPLGSQLNREDDNFSPHLMRQNDTT